jgi:hypothetical protein
VTWLFLCYPIGSCAAVTISAFHNATILFVVVVDAMLPQGYEPERTCDRAYCDTVPSGRPFSIQQKKNVHVYLVAKDVTTLGGRGY